MKSRLFVQTGNAYKEKAADLKGKTKLQKETGYQEKKDGSFDATTNNGDNSLNANPDANTKGFIHNHLDDYLITDLIAGTVTPIKPIRMFTPGDVNILMNTVNENVTSNDFSPYYVSMVTRTGHYMIKFSGTANDINTSFGGN